jgi:hypothetical protein
MKRQFFSAGRLLITVFMLSLIPRAIYAAEGGGDSSSVPLTFVFHGIADNALGSITYNYGLTYFVGAAATYGIVKSGYDW